MPSQTQIEHMKSVAERAYEAAVLNKPNQIREQHQDPNNLANWFPVLEATGVPVPRTIIVPLPQQTLEDFVNGLRSDATMKFCDGIDLARRHIGGDDVFIRSGIMSGKHSWEKTCRLPVSSPIWDHVAHIISDNAMACGASLPTCFAVREMLKTTPVFHAFWGNMPITKERRYFIRGGKVECQHSYWPLKAFKEQPTKETLRLDDIEAKLFYLNMKDDDEITHLTALSEKVALYFPGYWSLDWLQDASGKWYAIDMAEGERSYHWDGCEHK